MEKAPPKVFKVKDPDPDDRFSDIHPHLPQPPSLLLIVGSVKQGKSNLLVNLLCNPDMYKDKFDIVKIISNTLNADPKGKLMNKYFDCEDHYDDKMIHDLVKSQSQYDKDDMPSVCLVADDCLGDMKTNGALSNLSSRYRHSNIQLFIISTQLFRKVPTTVRANANWVLVGRLTNDSELDKLSEEYSGMFSGDANFREQYKKATKKKYDFMTLKLTENPAEIWINFNEKIYPFAEAIENVEVEEEEE